MGLVNIGYGYSSQDVVSFENCTISILLLLLFHLYTQASTRFNEKAAICAELQSHNTDYYLKSHSTHQSSIWPQTTSSNTNTSNNQLETVIRPIRQTEATIATAKAAIGGALTGWRVRILALFSGSETDLGLDYRLGRQVLKLAVARARRLNPELADIELQVLNDATSCDNVSSLPGKVANIFYAHYNDDNEPLQDDNGTCPSSSLMESSSTSMSINNSTGDNETYSCVNNSTQQPEDEHEIVGAKSTSSSGPGSAAGDYGRKTIDAILGPSCNSLVDQIARMAAYWQTPIYTVASVSGSFARKDIYSTLTRLSPSIDHLSMFAIRVMERFEWRHLAIIVDPSQTENMALLEGLEKTIERLRFTEPIFRRIFTIDSTFKTQTVLANDTSTGSNSTTPEASDVGASSGNGSGVVGDISDSAGSKLGAEVAGTIGNEDEHAARVEMDDDLHSAHCTRELRNTLRNTLRNVHRVARVVLLLLNEPLAVRRLLICAHELGMNNGEYAFLALNLGLKSGKRTTSIKNNDNNNNNGQVNEVGGSRASPDQADDRSTSSSASQQSLDWFVAGDEDNNLKARQMFESLMVLSVELPISDEYNYFVEQTLDLAHQDYPEVHFEHASVGPTAIALHDSLLLAVEAHKRRLTLVAAEKQTGSGGGGSNSATSIAEAGEDFVDRDEWATEKRVGAGSGTGTGRERGRRAPLMWNERFADGLVANMHINSRGDQEFDYVLSDMEPELGVLRPVASYAKETRRIQMLPNTYIHWPARLNAATGRMLHNDEPPPDEPECGFTGDAERCVDRQNLYTALLVLASFTSIILIVVALSVYRYRNIKYQMQLDDYWWKINWADLIFLAAGQQHQARSINSRCATSLVRQLTRQAAGPGGSVVSLGTKSNCSSILKGVAAAGSRNQFRVNLPTPASLDQARRKSNASGLSDGAASLALDLGAATHTTTTASGQHRSKKRESNVSFISNHGDANNEHFNSDSGSRIQQRRSAVPLIVTTPTAATKTQAHATEGRGSIGSAIPAPLAAAAGSRTDGASGVGGGQLALSQLDIGSNLMIRSELSTVVRASSLAFYKNELVIVKQLNGHSIEVSRELLVELKSIRELSNENLARLVGLCLEPGHLSIIYEYCSRGNLQDLLLNGDIAIDWNLKYSIIGDIINGLNFVHTTLLDCHGRLKSTNLVLDSRFTVKLTDFGLKHLYSQLELIESHEHDDSIEGVDNDEGDEDEDNVGNEGGPGSFGQRRGSNAHTIYNMDSVSIRAEKFEQRRQGAPQHNWGRQDSLGQQANRSGVHSMHQSSGAGTGRGGNRTRPDRMRLNNRGSARFFWTAPEHLRQRQPHLAASKRGDIYSLAIIFYEILTRKEPYFYGTTAKPRWQLIKRDKLRHQVEQHQQHAQQHQEPSRHSSSSLLQLQQQQHQSHSGAGSRAGSIINMALGRRGSSAVDQVESAAGGGRLSTSSSRQLKVGGSQLSGHGSGSNEAGQQQATSLSSKTKALARGLAHKRRSQNSVGPLEEHAETESCVSHSSSVASQLSQYKDPAQLATKSRINSFIESLGGGSVVGVSASADQEHVSKTTGDLEEEDEEADSVAGLEKSAFKSKSRAGATTSTGGDVLDADEILDQLRMGIQPEPIRPYIPNYLLRDVDARMVALLRKCWHETPSARPSASQVRSLLRRITKGATAKNYLDNLLDRLQTYAGQLERIVESKSGDIMAEKMRTEELLYQLVPKFVADRLKRSEPIVPQVFESVTIFFSDIIGFQKYASVMSPCELVDLLNNIYSSFESIISSFDVTKIEVILDQFLVASGISLEQQLQPGQQQQQVDNQEKPADSAKLSRQESVTKNQASGPQARLKRRLLGALKSQSSEDRGSVKSNKAFNSIDSAGGDQRQQQQLHKGDSIDQAAISGSDIEHYKRTSAEQIARMALCIRDLVKSFHFRQKLDPSESNPTTTSGQQNITRQASIDKDGPQAAQQQQQQADSATGTVAARPGGGGGTFVATSFNIRVGIHSGRVCAGIVGVKRPKYCLIGDTVNVASRMHTNSKANRIQVSSATRELLKQVPGFSIEPRGRIEIKGKGLMETYWLESAY